MTYNHQRALELLRTGSGYKSAEFREGQEEAIRHIVDGKGRLLVVQKTGWGKSFVYFIATKLLREGGAGPALLISPLLALMRNQIAAAERIEAPLGPRSIGNDFQAQPGKALSYWGGEGWGALVRQGKYGDGHFSDDLVAACMKMIQEWNPQPTPGWVTCVPSLRHPHLVPDFAKRLADALGLQFHAVIKKTDLRPEQKKMENNIQQARNVDGSLALNGNPIPKQPVLLVDDMVDSRWTFTVCSWLLRKSGSGEVWPMALAQTGFDE